MIYLLANKKLYFFMEMGVLVDTFYFYLDLQLFYIMTLFIFSSETGQLCIIVSVYISFTVRAGTFESYCLSLKSL